MTNLEVQELKRLSSKAESLNKEETARYRELLAKEMEEDLYMGDQTS